MANYIKAPHVFIKKGTSVYSNMVQTNLTANNSVACFTTESFNDSTNIIKLSNTQISLRVGKKYKLKSSLKCGFSTTNTKVFFQYYNVTSASYIGLPAIVCETNYNTTVVSSIQPIAILEIVPIANTTIELRVQSLNAGNINFELYDVVTEIEEVEAYVPFAMSSMVATAMSITGLNIGSIPFIGTTKNVNEDNTNLFWDNTNKRLGIGINTPTKTLEVNGDIKSNTIMTPIIMGGSGVYSNVIYKTTSGIASPGSDHIFQTGTNGNLEILRLLNTGKLATGGETAPDISYGGLCLNQGSNDTSILTFKSSDVTNPFTTLIETDTYVQFIKASATLGGILIGGYSDGDGNGIILNGFIGSNTPTLSPIMLRGYKSNGTTGATAIGASEKLFNIFNDTTEVLTQLGNGNVGINLTVPVKTLDVNGSFRVQSGDFQGIEMSYDNNTGKGLIRSYDIGDSIYTDLSLGYNDQLFLKSTGRVGIGAILPTYKLTIKANAVMPATPLDTTDGAQFCIQGFTDSSKRLVIGYDTTNNFGYLQCGYKNPNTTYTDMYLQPKGGKVAIGNVVAPSYLLHLGSDSAGKPSTTTWTVTSDERTKEKTVLADIDRCYDIVKAIPLKYYTLKEKYYPNAVDRNMLGWIAQDVEKVFPKAVTTYKFITKPEIKDANGNVLYAEESLQDCKNLQADQLIKVMWGTIQKLQQKVELLENK